MPSRAPHRAIIDRPLDAELSRMAALVESQLQGAIGAFERRDVALAQRLIDNDARIDEFDREIETRVVALLSETKRSEEAIRELTTIMKLSGEMERVGDLAKNVAKRSLVVSRESAPRCMSGVARMGWASLRQFSDVLNAYALRDLEAARAIWLGDDDLDELYNSVFQEILLAMMEDPAHVNGCTHLVFIAKNFERVGDHATNVAEALFFLATGAPVAEPRPKGDVTSITRVSEPVALKARGGDAG